MTVQEIDAKADEKAGGESSTSHLDDGVKLDPEHFDDDSDNLIDTVETVGGIDISTGGAREEKALDKGKEEGEEGVITDEGKTASEKADEAKTELDSAKVPEEFHKHPAWQRVIQERNQAQNAVGELEKRVKVLETPATEKEAGTTKIFSNLNDEELLEWQNDDPRGYANAFLKESAKNIDAIVDARIAQREESAKADKSYDRYGNDNPDNKDGTGFVQMWNSGEIKQYQEQNPRSTPIEAHLQLTMDAKIKQASEEAAAKAKEEVTKQYQARVVTDGLSGGPAYTPKSEEQELQQTKKKGGVVSVLADRLARRRKLE